MKLFLLLLFFGTALSAPVIPADFNLFDDNVDVKVDDGNIVLTNKETGSVRTVDQKGVISGDEEVNVDDTQDDYDAVDGKQEDFPVEDTQEDESDASDEMITEYVLNTPAETPDPQYDPKVADAEDREDPEEAEDPPGEPEEPEEPTEEPGDNDANGETEE